MLVLDAAATERNIAMPELVAGLREAFASPATVPLRHVHKIECDGAEGTSLLMPAWSADGFYGVKIINIFPGNAQRGLPGLHGVYALFDAKTGVPLAFLDADVLTAYRTAAASALAARYLAREDASRLLVVGAGRVARLLPAAMAAVRPIAKVAVWNRTFAGAQRMAAEFAAAGFDATAVESLEEGVRAADIVSCATLSNVALVAGDWLAPGSHLDLIGSFTPAMREADGVCFQRGSVFVDTDEAPAKAGDILSAVEEGHLTVGDIRATLDKLVAGAHRGRESSDEITVFKAVGSALEDLAAARLVYRNHVASNRD
jgi:ornithine cyclodeaminase